MERARCGTESIMKPVNIRQIFFLITGIGDALLSMLFMLMCVVFSTDHMRTDLGMAIVFLAISVCWTIVAIHAFVKSKTQKVLIIHTVLLKATVFAFGFAIMCCFPIVDGTTVIEAAFVMGLIGVMLAAGAIATGKITENASSSSALRFGVKRNQQVERKGFEGFKAKWNWDAAAKEYMQIYHLEPEQLSGAEQDKIYEYASMPFVYLFRWLIEHKYLAGVFHGDLGDSIRNEIKNGLTTPLELLKGLDYAVTREDLSPEILPFLNWYDRAFDAVMPYGVDTVHYDFDYYDCVCDGRAAFYCNEYSDLIYEKIAERIDARYAEYCGYLCDPEQDETEITVSCKYFACDLKITTIGSVSEAYVTKCKNDFEQLSEDFFDKLCAEMADMWLYANAGDNREALVKQCREEFHPDELIIFEPKGEECAYVLAGEADFEEEHGVSVAIRGGILLGLDYRMDYANPWSNLYEREYHLLQSSEGIGALRTSRDMENAKALGKIGLHYLIPISMGGSAAADNQIYLTTFAANLKERCDRRMEVLLSQGVITEVDGHCKYDQGSSIPKEVYVMGKNAQRIVFSQRIDVWR